MDFSKKTKKKIRKKFILASMGCLVPFLSMMMLPMLIIITMGGGTTSMVPSADEESINELQRVATQCGVSWEEILAYTTVVHENNFEQLEISAIIEQFLIVQYEEFTIETVEVEREVKDPETGETKKVKTTEEKKVIKDSGLLESGEEIRAYAEKKGAPDGAPIENVISHLKSLNTEEHNIMVSGKDIMDFYETLNENQKDWYNALISENIIQIVFGDYYDLPEKVIVETTGYFAWPVPGVMTITSPFGWREDPVYGGRGFHQGIDIAGAGCKGKPVVSAAAGKVLKVQHKTTGYGLNILVEHIDEDGRQWNTRYAHLNQIGVKEGDSVERGTVIGAVGSTGKSTGPHLHFEIIHQGSPVDPRLFY